MEELNQQLYEVVLFRNGETCAMLFVIRFFGAWRSLVARLPWAQEVPGSNPGAPTISYLNSTSRNCVFQYSGVGLRARGAQRVRWHFAGTILHCAVGGGIAFYLSEGPFASYWPRRVVSWASHNPDLGPRAELAEHDFPLCPKPGSNRQGEQAKRVSTFSAGSLQRVRARLA